MMSSASQMLSPPQLHPVPKVLWQQQTFRWELRGWAEKFISWFRSVVPQGPQQWNWPWHALIKINLSWYCMHCFLLDEPTLDKYFRTLKNSTRDISWTAWKTDGGSPVSCRTMLLYTSLWLQWLLCLTGYCHGWSRPPFIFSWFGTIWILSVPQHERNHCPGKTVSPINFSAHPRTSIFEIEYRFKAIIYSLNGHQSFEQCSILSPLWDMRKQPQTP